MADVETLRNRMSEAIQTGEIFEIVYHGGSNPGARRRIAPIAVFKDQIRARCYTSNAVKPFVLAKIEIVDPDKATEPVWTDTPASKLLIITDPNIVLAACRTALEAAGWDVTLTAKDGMQRIELRGWFKNGKLKPYPTHSLCYTPTTSDSIWLEDGSAVQRNHRPNPKPWRVTSVAYTDLQKPLAAFLAAAGVSGDIAKSVIDEVKHARC